MKTRLFCTLLALMSFFSFKTATDTYELDKGHTFIEFGVERFMVGEVSGRFNEFNGNVSIEGDDITTLKADITIQAGSLDTNHKTRDGHLRSKIWLDTEQYPEINFKSTSVSKGSDGKVMMSGDFTIHGVTKNISFPVEILGPFKDPTQNVTIGIRTDFTIDRFDYGIKFNKKMDNGSFFIGNEVRIKVRALAARRS
ncbi:hypothetical protein GWK08_13040 [Leptobacterium flavescens]|uniref:Lipid/polyisoprenoid-binding YceI-like domain-containing protein n=1 Tax=Leptobacterium flavescens TaxID=472055 RepID=A0A6P0UPF6_9FLAO|nr:YceI family protein [Leptobacterium flavescens]NER14372.1 hypothetical protein [Leptobacterium flavescens]